MATLQKTANRHHYAAGVATNMQPGIAHPQQLSAQIATASMWRRARRLIDFRKKKTHNLIHQPQQNQLGIWYSFTSTLLRRISIDVRYKVRCYIPQNIYLDLMMVIRDLFLRARSGFQMPFHSLGKIPSQLNFMVSLLRGGREARTFSASFATFEPRELHANDQIHREVAVTVVDLSHHFG